MSIANVPAGNNIPDDFNVIIEIPAHGGAVKYEVDKASGLLVVDRFMPTSMHYPSNYGFVPNTLADDGDPVDVLVLTPEPLQPGCLIRSRAVGLLQMTDEAGEDSKVIAVPIVKACAQYANIQSLDDIADVIKQSIAHFFEHYKDLEPNKWVKVKGWGDKQAAAHEIQSSVERFQRKGVEVG